MTGQKQEEGQNSGVCLLSDVTALTGGQTAAQQLPPFDLCHLLPDTQCRGKPDPQCGGKLDPQYRRKPDLSAGESLTLSTGESLTLSAGESLTINRAGESRKSLTLSAGEKPDRGGKATAPFFGRDRSTDVPAATAPSLTLAPRQHLSLIHI